ncbi:MAG: hypothetical protein ABL973_15070 [Micropepsaceae bacterium]
MHDTIAQETKTRERGIALVAVLGFLAVMSLIVIGVVGAAHSTVSSASQQLVRAQAQAAIESGVEYAANALADARGTIPEILGSPQTLDVGGFRVKISVRPERAKIDINYADENMLGALFRSAGADGTRAQSLASAIEDWRDADDLMHLNGAEFRQYQDAGLAYGPSNRMFESVGELRLVYGMSDALFACIRPQLTILTQAPGIDIGSADPMIQREMGFEPATRSAPTSGPSVVSGQLIAPGDVYEITAELDDPKRAVRRGEKVSVRVTGNPDDPYWLLNIEPVYPLREAAELACPHLPASAVDAAIP